MALPYRIGNKTVAPTVRWWLALDANIGAEMTAWCNKIEANQWGRRFDLLSYYRYLTGRPGYFSYNYSCVTRPVEANRYGRAKWTAPVKNILAMAYSALNARVYKNRVALQVCPDAGNQDSRDEAKTQTRYLDALHANGFWDKVEECGFDSVCAGKGFLKIDTGLDGKEICRTVIKPDELIIDPTEASVNDVQTAVIRLFCNRYVVADMFPDKAKEILLAPPAELGFAYSGAVDTSDVIVLRDGYHKGDKDCGVHALTVGDCLLKCEREEIERFPWAELVCQPLGYWGKGLVEDSLPMQRAHNRLSRAIEENMVRSGWPRVGIIKNSGVNEGEIAAGSSMFFHYNKDMAPAFIAPTVITEDQFRYHAELERGILDQWGVSEQQVAGTGVGADASGRARLAQDQIDDRRHVPLLQHLEDFIEDCGYLEIAAARKIKPKLVLVGKAKQAIDYPGFSKDVKIRAFPMSSIPQSVAGRQDWIDRAFAQNRISAETKTRLEGMPDIDGEVDQMTASSDLVTWQLDQIIETGKYLPPTGVGDLRLAFTKCQTRIQYETRHELDPDRLSLLYQYLASVDEMLADAEPPPVMAPGMAGPGAVPPPGGAAPEGPTLPANIPTQ
jgi:hypothetical protein